MIHHLKISPPHGAAVRTTHEGEIIIMFDTTLTIPMKEAITALHKEIMAYPDPPKKGPSQLFGRLVKQQCPKCLGVKPDLDEPVCPVCQGVGTVTMGVPTQPNIPPHAPKP